MIIYKLRKNILKPLKYQLKALIKKMPSISINLGNNKDSIVNKWYLVLNKYIPILTFTTNKKIAVACLPIKDFNNLEDYLNTVKGKNSADYFSRRAIKKNYLFNQIDRNNFIDPIFEINTSSEIRQKKKMSLEYSTKIMEYINEEFNEYYGVFTSDNKLVAYADVAFLNEAAFIYIILGHKKFLDDGIMYFLITSIVNKSILYKSSKYPSLKYIIYDSFLTNSDGLTLFKKRFGFKPYKVKWIVN